MIAALVTLARPRLLPFVLLLPGLGYGLAHWDRALPLTRPAAGLAVLGAWTLLSSGTLWLNALLDRDEGEVLLGTSVLPPAGTALAAGVVLAASVGVAGLAGPAVGALAALCAALAVAYSHPALAWKGHAALGPAVNVVGYGLASPLAGYLAAGHPPGWRASLVILAVAAGVWSSYDLAQSWQGEEDAARGYRTLAARRGGLAAVRAARAWLHVAGAIGVALVVAGWLPRALLALALAAPWVEAPLRAASRGETAISPALAVKHAQRVVAVAVLGVVVLTALYRVEARSGMPRAGLATHAGHPQP